MTTVSTNATQSTYDLWVKAIRAKEYTKSVVTLRVTILKNGGVFNQTEYDTLMALIEEVYG